jgi:hypothetical protein
MLLAEHLRRKDAQHGEHEEDEVEPPLHGGRRVLAGVLELLNLGGRLGGRPRVVRAEV